MLSLLCHRWFISCPTPCGVISEAHRRHDRHRPQTPACAPGGRLSIGPVAAQRQLMRARTCRLRSHGRDVAAQQGFSLIEISIVTAIVLLLAIIAIPAVGAYVVENKVPRVGEELARFVLQTQINAQPGNQAPYADIDTANLARMVSGSTVLSIREAGGTVVVNHGLGSDGTITVTPGATGDSFMLTMSKVSHAACPALASVLQRVMDTITISPEGGSGGTVKSASIEYNALQAESRCGRGDVNTFEFTAS